MSPTTILLMFTLPLDPSTAQDVRNYRIVGPGGLALRISSAVYDPARQTVTLHPWQRLNLHLAYTLTVNGTNAGGIVGVDGVRLDGKMNGIPGTNFQATLTWRNLGMSVPAKFRQAKPARAVVLPAAKSIQPAQTRIHVAKHARMSPVFVKVKPVHAMRVARAKPAAHRT